jgi:hypothetical protein
MTDATKKRIRVLMDRWCSARHDAASEKAWAELDVEFDKLQEVSGG